MTDERRDTVNKYMRDYRKNKLTPKQKEKNIEASRVRMQKFRAKAKKEQENKTSRQSRAKAAQEESKKEATI